MEVWQWTVVSRQATWQVSVGRQPIDKIYLETPGLFLDFLSLAGALRPLGPFPCESACDCLRLISVWLGKDSEHRHTASRPCGAVYEPSGCSCGRNCTGSKGTRMAGPLVFESVSLELKGVSGGVSTVGALVHLPNWGGDWPLARGSSSVTPLSAMLHKAAQNCWYSSHHSLYRIG
ncbi:hypothetical protein E2C01_003006 [Portunus trituberculatus]|uniref:Uncharacterized protein n=1 Tax=Portunus trituberculatus TaxID=210409 RepID=A0A5B7CL00_PORTR|nr:hypothetical protein [Portunus trituberculatus]